MVSLAGPMSEQSPSADHLLRLARYLSLSLNTVRVGDEEQSTTTAAAEISERRIDETIRPERWPGNVASHRKRAILIRQSDQWAGGDSGSVGRQWSQAWGQGRRRIVRLRGRSRQAWELSRDSSADDAAAGRRLVSDSQYHNRSPIADRRDGVPARLAARRQRRRVITIGDRLHPQSPTFTRMVRRDASGANMRSAVFISCRRPWERNRGVYTTDRAQIETRSYLALDYRPHQSTFLSASTASIIHNLQNLS
uniref:Uncharacterized protein n=1 Tax=Plectus sambesii TaxID=2011161 RepID=A0A914VWM8_9BILA